MTCKCVNCNTAINYFHLLLVAPLFLYIGFSAYKGTPIPNSVLMAVGVIGIAVAFVHGNQLYNKSNKPECKKLASGDPPLVVSC